MAEFIGMILTTPEEFNPYNSSSSQFPILLRVSTIYRFFSGKWALLGDKVPHSNIVSYFFVFSQSIVRQNSQNMYHYKLPLWASNFKINWGFKNLFSVSWGIILQSHSHNLISHTTNHNKVINWRKLTVIVILYDFVTDITWNIRLVMINKSYFMNMKHEFSQIMCQIQLFVILIIFN